MRVPVSDIASQGVVKDIADYLLPPNTWTDAKNVRVRDKRLLRSPGYTAVLDPPTVAPYWLLPVISSTKEVGIIYAGLNKVYTFLSNTHSNITRQTAGVDVNYSATADGLWNGGILGGIPILNNGFDKPQQWSTISGGTKLADLTNWPATYLARIIVPFKQTLFACDITEGGVRYPNRLRWSHPAQPGGVPATWDDTDTTKDAGISELTDVLAGSIVDAVVLRDTLIFYKERSTWGAQFTGGEYKYRIYQIFENIGALDDHCACAYAEGGRHFVFTGEDLINHDGQNWQSIADDRLRRWILSNISSTNYGRTFVVPHNDQKECWLCLPLEGSSWPNVAVIWNYKDNTISYRDLPSLSAMAPTQIPNATSDPWDSDTQQWDLDTTTWDNLATVGYTRELMAAAPDATKLFRMDQTVQANGVSYSSYIEKTGISIYGTDQDGNVLADIERNKLVRSIYPRATGGRLQVQIGRQTAIEGSTLWGPTHDFIPGTDQKVDVLDDFLSLGGACKLYGLRFLWPDDSAAELRSYDIDVEGLGTF